METGEKDYRKINLPDDQLSKVVYDGRNYWILLENSHDVYQWNKEQDEYIWYKAEEVKWESNFDKLPYSTIVCSGSEIILANFYARNVMRVNSEKMVLEKAFDYPKNFGVAREMKWGAMFSNAEIINNEVWLLPQRGNMILKYDLNTQGVQGIKLAIPEEQIPYFDDIYEEKYLSNKCLYETESVFSLTKYMNKKQKHLSNGGKKEDIGHLIYKRINYDLENSWVMCL